MILYDLIMKTALGSQSKKMFLNIPTVEEVAKVIGIHQDEVSIHFNELEMLTHGAPFTWTCDKPVGKWHQREVQTWVLKAEKYHQGEHADPVMDPKAWEAAYRKKQLEVIDLEVQLSKLRANWIEFSGAISECYNKAFGYQMEMFALINPIEGYKDRVKQYKPNDEDRDRFYTLLNYLDPAMVDPKTNHNK